MKPLADRAHDLTLRIAEKTLERILADRERVSVQVEPLIDHLAENLLHPDLQTGIHGKRTAARFAEQLGRTPKEYVLDHRMEIATALLRDTDVEIWRIGTNVGYSTPGSFSRAFKRRYGQPPKEYRRAHRLQSNPRAPSEAERETARETVRRLQQQQARIFLRFEDLEPPSPEALAVEPQMARNAWRKIRDFAPELQPAAVDCQLGFRTPALFHLLCARSLELGAGDDVRGLQLAGLAIQSLEGLVGQVDEPVFRSLEARAWTVAAQAFHRSGDRRAAAQAFAAAEQSLYAAGDDAHPVTVAELNHYMGAHLIAEGDLENGLPLLEISVKILRALADKLAPDEES